MNTTYNREFTKARYSARRSIAPAKSFAEKFFEFLSFVYAVVSAIVTNETVIMTLKISASLSCLAGLVSVVHFVEVGKLGFITAILISLILLAVVAFIFRGEE